MLVYMITKMTCLKRLLCVLLSLLVTSNYSEGSLCDERVYPSEYSFRDKDIIRFERNNSNCTIYSNDTAPSFNTSDYVLCSGGKSRLNDSEYGPGIESEDDGTDRSKYYYVWKRIPDSGSRVLYTFPHQVNVTHIKLHYYSNFSAKKSRPSVTVYQVDAKYEIWRQLPSAQLVTIPAEQKNSGLPEQNHMTSEAIQFSYNMKLAININRFPSKYAHHQLYLSEVEFFFCSREQVPTTAATTSNSVTTLYQQSTSEPTTSVFISSSTTTTINNTSPSEDTTTTDIQFTTLADNGGVETSPGAAVGIVMGLTFVAVAAGVAVVTIGVFTWKKRGNVYRLNKQQDHTPSYKSDQSPLAGDASQKMEATESECVFDPIYSQVDTWITTTTNMPPFTEGEPQYAETNITSNNHTFESNGADGQPNAPVEEAYTEVHEEPNIKHAAHSAKGKHIKVGETSIQKPNGSNEHSDTSSVPSQTMEQMYAVVRKPLMKDKHDDVGVPPPLPKHTVEAMYTAVEKPHMEGNSSEDDAPQLPPHTVEMLYTAVHVSERAFEDLAPPIPPQHENL